MNFICGVDSYAFGASPSLCIQCSAYKMWITLVCIDNLRLRLSLRMCGLFSFMYHIWRRSRAWNPPITALLLNCCCTFGPLLYCCLTTHTHNWFPCVTLKIYIYVLFIAIYLAVHLNSLHMSCLLHSYGEIVTIVVCLFVCIMLFHCYKCLNILSVFTSTVVCNCIT